jgi:hypothetical protein
MSTLFMVRFIKMGNLFSVEPSLAYPVDSREVIIAPISGWIKIIEAAQSPCPPDQGLRVEIWEGDARAAVPH